MKKMEHKTTIYDALLRYADQIKTMICTMFAFLNIDADIVKILMLLMFLDTVFGITKSIVLKKDVTKGILFLGLLVKMVILLIPMVLALVGKGLKYDFTPIVDGVLRVLVASEGLSIFTSMYVIKTKKDVKNFDIITLLLSSIRKALFNLIKMWLGQIEQPNEINNKKKE